MQPIQGYGSLSVWKMVFDGKKKGNHGLFAVKILEMEREGTMHDYYNDSVKPTAFALVRHKDILKNLKVPTCAFEAWRDVGDGYRVKMGYIISPLWVMDAYYLSILKEMGPNKNSDQWYERHRLLVCWYTKDIYNGVRETHDILGRFHRMLIITNVVIRFIGNKAYAQISMFCVFILVILTINQFGTGIFCILCF